MKYSLSDMFAALVAGLLIGAAIGYYLYPTWVS